MYGFALFIGSICVCCQTVTCNAKLQDYKAYMKILNIIFVSKEPDPAENAAFDEKFGEFFKKVAGKVV